MSKTITPAEIVKIPQSNGRRCSVYCPECGQQRGSSMGCVARTATQGFTWWKCGSCKHLYDLTITEFGFELRDGCEIDAPKKGKKKAA